MTSPFDWKGKPSIFANDLAVKVRTADGKSMSQVRSETIARKTKAMGRSPGTIKGLSKKADKALRK